MPLPKIVVFDLDATVWEPELYLMRGKFSFDRNSGKVKDRSGNEIWILDGCRETLLEILSNEAYKNRVQIGFASRADDIEDAIKCLELLRVKSDDGQIDVSLKEISVCSEIYPRDKKNHFRNIAAKTGFGFDEMIFFDNENRNVQSVAELGVLSVYTPEGMTLQAWKEGLKRFEQRNK